MHHLRSQIRLITFDLDDTLWPCFSTIHKAETATFEWLQANAPNAVADHSVDTLRHHRKGIAEQFPEIAHDMTELRLRALQHLFEPHGYDDELAQQASDLFRDYRNKVFPYPQAKETLLQLKQHYTLVSLTNGNAQIEHTPLHDCFHHSLDAAGVGKAKPHPAMFEHAMALTDVDKSQMLHIGDDPFRDVAAARSFGIASVWVNREASHWPIELPQPDWQVSDVAELLAFLLPAN